MLLKDYQFILSEIKKGYLSLLNENLVGIYVHGSIAFDCFNWSKSDIDFIVVVKQSLTPNKRREILDFINSLRSISPPKGIEMSVLLLNDCQNFTHPCRYDLHYSEAWYTTDDKKLNEICLDGEKTDPDLAAHLTIIKNCGIVLYGDPIDSVFGEVTREDYIDSLIRDTTHAPDEILNQPMYIVLNLCRIMAYLKDGVILSKEKGADWGSTNLDQYYKPLIDSAALSYTTNHRMHYDKNLAKEFATAMLEQIKTLR